jgi:hypothetical protein
MKRDANDMEIFRALQLAGCEPERGRDADIYAKHFDGRGMILEVKVKKGRLRPLQIRLQALFGDRYHVVRSVTDALIACGRIV